VQKQSGELPGGVAPRFLFKKNNRGNGDSRQQNFGKFVRLLIVSVGDMIELDTVEIVLEGSYGVVVGLHLVIVTTHILRCNINDV
jgi:hypothetical protein